MKTLIIITVITIIYILIKVKTKSKISIWTFSGIAGMIMDKLKEKGKRSNR
jgi:hypothetical protein